MKREQIMEILELLERWEYLNYDPSKVHRLAEELEQSLTQQDEPSVSAEDKLLCYIDYIIALVDYIKLINEELDEVAVLAHAHGWRTSRFNEGVEMREKLNKCAKDCLLPQQFPPKTEK
jgi:hypothetical protein